MKRRILSLVLVMVVLVSILSGCGLVNVNNARQMKQPVITIGNGTYQDVVTRYDIINAMNSYGIYYVFYYGYSVEETVEVITDSLINTKIMLFSATENMPKISQVKKMTEFNKYDVFFTAEELATIRENVNKYISNQIDLQEKEIIAENLKNAGVEVETETVRTTPGDYSDDYLANVPLDFVGTDTRAQAVAKFRRLCENAGNVESYEDYVNTIYVTNVKNELLEKYKKVIVGDLAVSEDEIKARYNAILEREKEQYALNSDLYASKLAAIQSAKEFADSNFVIYAPEAGYGFAVNLLIKFNAEQEAKIKEWNDAVKAETMTEEEFVANRAELVKELVASDERKTYLTNYGYDSTLFDAIKFDGVATPTLVDGVQVRDDKGLWGYEEITPNEYTVDEFMTKLHAYVGGELSGTIDGFEIYKSDIADKQKFIDMIWAYGDDTGSMGTEVGYVCYPDTSKSPMVAEYAEASKVIATCEPGSYTTCITDYGVHIVYLVEAYNEVGIVNEYNAADKDKVGTFSYNFYNEMEEDMLNAKYSDLRDEIFASYEGKANFVKWDEKLKAEIIAFLYDALSDME